MLSDMLWSNVLFLLPYWRCFDTCTYRHTLWFFCNTIYIPGGILHCAPLVLLPCGVFVHAKCNPRKLPRELHGEGRGCSLAGGDMAGEHRRGMNACYRCWQSSHIKHINYYFYYEATRVHFWHSFLRHGKTITTGRFIRRSLRKWNKRKIHSYHGTITSAQI